MRMPAQMPRFQAVITTVAATTDKPWPVLPVGMSVLSKSACQPVSAFAKRVGAAKRVGHPTFSWAR